MFHIWVLGFLYVSHMVIRVFVCFTYGSYYFRGPHVLP